jgi:hypothetical protein
MKARTLINTENPSYAVDHATHNRTDGACCSFTVHPARDLQEHLGPGSQRGGTPRQQ